MRLVTESFPGARASWLGGSLVRGGYRDLRPRHHRAHPRQRPYLHTKLEPLPRGDLIGAQLARQRPGPVLDRLRLRARPVLQPRPTPPPRPPARAAPGRAPADPATGAVLLLVPSPREATVPHRELPGLRLG